MRVRNIYVRFIILIFMLFQAVFMSCASDSFFDETAWLERINAVDPQLLYANNRDEEGKFFNPWMPRSGEQKSRGRFRRMFRQKPVYPDFDVQLYSATANNYDYLANPDFNSISFAGHASFFIKIDGNTIITDPFFSNRAVIVSKKVKVRIDFSKIPENPVVLISHNHYDHLDTWTIKRLIAKNAVFVVPAGLGSFFTRRGAAEVYELDWWQDVTINSVKYTFLPAQHWAMRVGSGRNTSLWGGFVIEASKTIYFSGDSGYFVGFREFGNRFNIDYAIIGVGAYDPRWFMAYQHLNVPEFFMALDDLRAAVAIPMHFGVISLSDEPLLYPLYEIDVYLNENPQYRGRVNALRVGDYIELGRQPD